MNPCKINRYNTTLYSILLYSLHILADLGCYTAIGNANIHFAATLIPATYASRLYSCECTHARTLTQTCGKEYAPLLYVALIRWKAHFPIQAEPRIISQALFLFTCGVFFICLFNDMPFKQCVYKHCQFQVGFG